MRCRSQPLVWKVKKLPEMRKSPRLYRPPPRNRENRLFPLLAGGSLLIIHAAIFLRFFPNTEQRLGHDFAYFFPALLDGYFWFQSNGLWEIPWFSPAACGGVPVLPNVLRGYYTVSQFLTFLCDPLNAVRLNLLIFAFTGLWGTYLLLRRSFYLSRETALYGAALFLFNGFFTHRMLIGHLGYCYYMLLPLIAALVLEPDIKTAAGNRLACVTNCLLAACLLAAAVQSEFVTTIIPAIMAILLIGLVHGLIHGRTAAFLLRLCTAGLIGILLSLARLTSILYLLGNFSRDAYKLPGAPGWLEAAGLILRSLIISPAYDPSRLEAYVNVQYFVDRHEWEYSVTPVPFIVIAIGLAVLTLRLSKGTRLPSWVPVRWRLVIPIVLLLLLPVALNSYYPAWNALLKQLPVIGSSSSLARWIIAYIPFVILLSALVIEKAIARSKPRTFAVLACMTAVIVVNTVVDRDYYQAQGYYDPTPITRAWHRSNQGLQTPNIDKVMVYRDDTGMISMPAFRNDIIAYGGSQLLCYEALFGYWLEFFPRGDLLPGLVTDVYNGRYNLKNPACYVWPAQNRCEPGEHFRQSEKTALLAFAGYKPFPFKVPVLQADANWINGIALVSVALYFLIRGLQNTISRRRHSYR